MIADSKIPDDGRPPRWRRVIDLIFGYDYFISYAWSDGREYATNLLKALESQRLKCFLDSEEFAKGANWRIEARRALKKTTRLVLVGSPAAIESEAVENEIEIFHGLHRHIIPISFDGSMDHVSIASKKIGELIGPEIIRIDETKNALSSGPSDEVAKGLTTSFNILTQDQKRARLFGGAAFLFIVIAIVAISFWVLSESNRRLADKRLNVATTRLNNSLSLALSRASHDQLTSFQQDELSALLAVQAWTFARRGDGSTLPEADASLRSVGSKRFFGQRLFFPYRKDRDIEGISFVQNSGDIVVAGEYSTWQFSKTAGKFVSRQLFDRRLELVASSPEGKWTCGVAKRDLEDYSQSRYVLLFKSLESSDETTILAPPGNILSLRFLTEHTVLVVTDNGAFFEIDRPEQQVTEIGKIEGLQRAWISPEGKKVAWVDPNSELFVGNLKHLGTNTDKIPLQTGNQIESVFFSPRSKLMGVLSDDTVYVIDLARPDIVSPEISVAADSGKRRIFSGALSTNRVLALGHDSGDISLHDLSSLGEVARLAAEINANGDAVGNLEFTPNGNTLLSASSQSVHRWSLEAPWYAGRRVSDLDCDLLVLHDGERATVVGRDKGSPVTKLTLGQHGSSAVTVIGSTSGFYTEGMDVSREGRWIAVGYTNDPVEVFDTKSMHSVKLRGVGGRDGFNELRFSSDGDWLYGASGYNGPVVRWSVGDFRKAPEELIPAGEIDYYFARFLEDDKTLVVWNNEKAVSVSLTEPSLPSEIFDVKQQLSEEYEIGYAAAVSAKASKIAFTVGRDQPGDRRSAVVLVPLDSRKADALVQRGFTGAPRTLRFSEDGSVLAAGFGYDDPKVLIWKLSELPHRPYKIGLHPERVNDIRFRKGMPNQMVSCGTHGLSQWTIDSGIFADGICQRVGRRGMSQEEWDEFVGNKIPYEISCK